MRRSNAKLVLDEEKVNAELCPVPSRKFLGGKSGVLQPIMPLDSPVKVRPWELTVYPRSHIRR